MKYDERELKRSLMKIETLLADIYDERGIQKKICPICESEVRLFTPYGEKLRPNAKCPVCGSLERTRAWWLYFKKIGLLNGVDQKIKILHFAPEKPLWQVFCKDINIDYFPVDYNPNYVGIRDVVDITNILYEDDMFDVIICNHVLEHIVDEKKALCEMKRVLKRDGVLYFTVPISSEDKTFENQEYNTEELRSKHYGQKDHVRLYGTDIQSRLEKAGFVVERIDSNEEYSDEEKKLYGLSSISYIWNCRKRV